jgi:hypothetical protein
MPKSQEKTKINHQRKKKYWEFFFKVKNYHNFCLIFACEKKKLAAD